MSVYRMIVYRMAGHQATREEEDVDVPSNSDEPPSGQSPQERFTSWGDEKNAAVMPVSEVSVRAMKDRTRLDNPPPMGT